MAFEDLNNVTLRINIESDSAKFNEMASAISKYRKSSDEARKANQNLLRSFTRLRVTIVSAIIAYGTLRGAIEGVVKPAAEFQANMVGLERVSKNTGRSFSEMKGLIKDLNHEFGGMVDQATLANAVLKLSSTPLTTEQMKEFIQVVADGATAMGEDFATQLPIVTKGFKQLNPAIIDNIGINVRLERAIARASTELGKNRDQLTENEKQIALFNEIMDEAYSVTGAFSDRQGTLVGQFGRVKAAATETAVAIGEAGLTDALTKATTVVADLVVNLGDLITRFSTFKSDLADLLGPEGVEQFNKLGSVLPGGAGILLSIFGRLPGPISESTDELKAFDNAAEETAVDVDNLAVDVDNLANQAFTLMGYAVDDVRDKLKGLKGEISTIQDRIDLLFNRRFAGETAFQRQLLEQELAIKQFKLDNYDILNAVEDVTDGIQRETEAYEAWIESIDQSIKSLIQQGGGTNISTLLRQFQTARLSASLYRPDTQRQQTKSAEEVQLAEMEAAYEKDRLAFDINFTAKHDMLDLWKQQNEDVANGVNRSLSSTEEEISDLTGTLSELLRRENWLVKEESVITDSLEARRREWFLLKNEINGVINLLTEASSRYNQATSGYDPYPIEYSQPMSSSLPYPLPNYPGSPVAQSRAASGGIITKPTMVLAGEGGPEMIMPMHRAGGSLDQSQSYDNRKYNIVIPGYEGDKHALANELNRKLKVLG
jgi:hypothetical protein